VNTVAIQYIWQAIQESERSDDLPFIDVRNHLTQQRLDRFAAPDRGSIAAVTIDPLRTRSDSLPTVTWPR